MAKRQKQNSDVVVVGSSNTDLVIESAKLPEPGMTVLGGKYQIVSGGKGANQAVAAARTGAQVIFVANIGCDDFGDDAMARLDREGIGTKFVVRDQNAPSGVAFIMVGDKGRNLISVAASSNDCLSIEHIERAKSAFANAKYCLIQLEIPQPAVRAALSLSKSQGVFNILDPAPCRRLSKSLLQLVDIITPNEFELAELTGMPVKTKRNIECAGEKLFQTGVGEVIVTCGERGVCHLSSEGANWFSAPKVNAIDTVGAGDCFNGSLASALSSDLGMAEAIRFAVSTSAHAVTIRGVQSSFPELKPSNCY